MGGDRAKPSTSTGPSKAQYQPLFQQPWIDIEQASTSYSWFEYLLDPSKLDAQLEVLQKQRNHYSASPTDFELITTFLDHAEAVAEEGVLNARYYALVQLAAQVVITLQISLKCMEKKLSLPLQRCLVDGIHIYAVEQAKKSKTDKAKLDRDKQPLPSALSEKEARILRNRWILRVFVKGNSFSSVTAFKGIEPSDMTSLLKLAQRSLPAVEQTVAELECDLHSEEGGKVDIDSCVGTLGDLGRFYFCREDYEKAWNAFNSMKRMMEDESAIFDKENIDVSTEQITGYLAACESMGFGSSAAEGSAVVAHVKQWSEKEMEVERAFRAFEFTVVVERLEQNIELFLEGKRSEKEGLSMRFLRTFEDAFRRSSIRRDDAEPFSSFQVRVSFLVELYETFLGLNDYGMRMGWVSSERVRCLSTYNTCSTSAIRTLVCFCERCIELCNNRDTPQHRMYSNWLLSYIQVLRYREKHPIPATAPNDSQISVNSDQQELKCTNRKVNTSTIREMFSSYSTMSAVNGLVASSAEEEKLGRLSTAMSTLILNYAHPYQVEMGKDWMESTDTGTISVDIVSLFSAFSEVVTAMEELAMSFSSQQWIIELFPVHVLELFGSISAGLFHQLHGKQPSSGATSGSSAEEHNGVRFFDFSIELWSCTPLTTLIAFYDSSSIQSELNEKVNNASWTLRLGSSFRSFHLNLLESILESASICCTGMNNHENNGQDLNSQRWAKWYIAKADVVKHPAQIAVHRMTSTVDKKKRKKLKDWNSTNYGAHALEATRYYLMAASILSGYFEEGVGAIGSNEAKNKHPTSAQTNEIMATIMLSLIHCLLAMKEFLSAAILTQFFSINELKHGIGLIQKTPNEHSTELFRYFFKIPLLETLLYEHSKTNRTDKERCISHLTRIIQAKELSLHDANSTNVIQRRVLQDFLRYLCRKYFVSGTPFA